MSGQEKTKIASGINVIAGLWLMISSFIFGAGMASNEFVVGIIVAILSLVLVFSSPAVAWLGWVSAVMGLWLLISPLFYVDMALNQIWNSVILGVIVIAMGVWSAMSQTSTMGRGHPRMG